jgi:isopentenyl diphosphate isomerase/L-lactate dehydrogenase-like FMN-dependent dehydrogenase
VDRAAAAGAAALVLTGDTPVLGRKRRNSAEVAHAMALAGAASVADAAGIARTVEL